METFVRLRDDLSEQIRYDSAGYPIYIRETRFEQPQCFAIPNHWHDDLELIAVHSGQMLYYVNGESIPLTAGEGIIINARQIHYNFATGNAPCPFSCILLHPMLLCATAAYEHGSLAQAISVLSDNCLNIEYLRLKKHPTESDPDGLLIFLDFYGSLSDVATRASIMQMQSELPFFRLFGYRESV